MRLFTIVAVAVLLRGQISANAPAPLSQVLPEGLQIQDPLAVGYCNLGEPLDELLAPLEIAFGFENHQDCWLSRHPAQRKDRMPLVHQRLPVGGLTVSAALDEVTKSLGFSWKQIGPVVVVRPPDAWSSPTNVLNHSIKALDVSGRLIDDVLPQLFLATEPAVFEPVTRLTPVPDRLNTRTRMRFKGGTLLHALNQLIVEQGRIAWEVARSGVGHSTVLLYGLDEPFTATMTPIRSPKP
jgi:hypothetical protein